MNTHPVFSDKTYSMRVSEKFQHKNCIVDHVCIDPDKKPEDGSMVLCGSKIEPWNNQPNINGTVVLFGFNL